MLQYFTRRRKDQQKQPSCDQRSESRFQLSLGCVHCDNKIKRDNPFELFLSEEDIGCPLSKKCNNGNFLNPNEPEKFYFAVK